MSCYLIIFEVKTLAKRNELRGLMKKLGGYCPITRTSWAITTDQRAKEIRDYLKVATAPGDRLFVVRSGTEAAWKNAISTKHSDWLKANL
ncbi:MAG: hypothetical protein A3E01_15460 [Gammaproteobacteria bacterium RIFCSPHIGHO2_12_FULL_63_22]|nr:MAG: hypothetical protein A3E01_15460 [Gammaproteobacteria bacterium RIFCSPHIGHO2_12_FULL_63_22]